jgi:uncharacterized ferritin-like protein (DUF455 family)
MKLTEMKEFFDDKKCENKFVGILINDRKKHVYYGQKWIKLMAQ